MLINPLKGKIFYNRSANSAAFCVIQQMYINPPSLLIQLKQLNFLQSRISTNHKKGQKIQPNVNSLYPLLFLQCRIFFTLKLISSYALTIDPLHKHWSFMYRPTVRCLLYRLILRPEKTLLLLDGKSINQLERRNFNLLIIVFNIIYNLVLPSLYVCMYIVYLYFYQKRFNKFGLKDIHAY